MKVVQGENVWLLARTDRDAVPESEVLDTVGPAMVFFLKDGQPGTVLDKFGRAVQTRTETAVDLKPTSPDALREWRVDAARPVQAIKIVRAASSSSTDQPALPKASRVLATRSSFPGDGIPNVDATRPWWIVVRFWWRGSDAEIPFPVLKVSELGRRTREHNLADWYLERAIVPLVKTKDPGAETFGEKVEERAGEIVDDVVKVVGEGVGQGLKWGVGVGVAGGLLYLLWKSRSKST